jgi:hypothetical protein
MDNLAKLNDAATQGKWSSTRTLYVNYDSSERVECRYRANKEFAAALVNAFREGRLVEIEAVKLKEGS